VTASLEDPAVWNDPKKAQELGKEKKALDDIVLVLQRLDGEINDNLELFEMSKADNDEAGHDAGGGHLAHRGRSRKT